MTACKNFFNINAVWGCGAYEKPDFPTIKSLLDNMDYLGIDRSLAWYREAADLNPTAGNRTMLEEIDCCPEARERLIPAMVIEPASYYNEGAMEQLHAVFQSGRTKALRILPKTSRFPVCHIERVLGELAKYKPVLFWNIQKESGEHEDFRELAELAEKFPEINFVLTQSMWREFGEVLDLMWRCSNIHAGISWLHMRNAIELLVNEFGAERVLFGTDWRSHYGAVIAELNRSKISDEQREQIAHGNAERLLEFKPLEKSLCKPFDGPDKPLWRKFRDGRAIDEVKIIDSHSHTGPHTRGWFVKEVELERYIDAMEAQMDRNGVDHMLIIPEALLFGDPLKHAPQIEEIFKGHPRFSGMLAFNPHFAETMPPELDKIFAGGFYKGFKLLASYWKVAVTDPRYKAVWEYADKYRLPILLHTWDDSWNSPAMLTDIVKQYPNATFILGHSGGGDRGRAEAETLAMENDNVLLEVCGSFCSRALWEETFAKVGFDKVVFGSDTGAHSQAWELGHLLSVPVPDEKLIPVLAGNIERVLSKSLLNKN